jgi:hypothetical protein
MKVRVRLAPKALSHPSNWDSAVISKLYGM